MKPKLYIIEARDEAGQLLLRDAEGKPYPQPDTVFGLGSIHGMTEDAMAQVIFRRIPDATLDGGSIPLWPALINPNWKARVKTW